MKTVWDQKTIQRKPVRENEWVQMKRLELEAKTGVKWSHFTACGKHKFMPTWDWNEVSEGSESNRALLLETVGSRAATAKTFLQVQELTGLELGELMGVVKHLCKQSEATAVVDRMGKAIGYYRRMI